jgi:hypothetical protein
MKTYEQDFRAYLLGQNVVLAEEGRGQSLVELYLEALKSIGDKELNSLIDKEIKERPAKGRPTN